MPYDEQLFISRAEVVVVPVGSRAKVTIIKRFVPMFERLVIKNKKNSHAHICFG